MTRAALKKIRFLALGALAVAVLVSVSLIPQRPAYACTEDCSNVYSDAIQTIITFLENHIDTQLHFGMAQPIPPVPGQKSGIGELGKYQDFIIQEWWRDYVAVVLQHMTEQLMTIAMQQTLAIGTFIDAKHQMDVQAQFRRMVAITLRDYTPSLGMCVFGTNIVSLAAADYNGYLTEQILADRARQRALASANTSASEGPDQDRLNRVQQFSGRFCERYDNNAITGDANTGLGLICTAAPEPKTKNRDIDYIRTMLAPRTLEVDFSDGETTDDEEDVLAMASNLYGHRVFKGITDATVNRRTNAGSYLDTRSIAAKRGVAMTSFNALTAMKTQGSETANDTLEYMKVIMTELGIEDEEEIEKILGERPSYYAQLEFLAKRIYQRPAFFTELYESQANVKRRSVAMQAIDLMINHDISASRQRAESIMSMILESKLVKLQDDYENNMTQTNPSAQ